MSEHDVLTALARFFDTPLALYSSRGAVTAVLNGEPVDDVRTLGITAVPDGFSIEAGGKLVPLITARALAALVDANAIEKVPVH